MVVRWPLSQRPLPARFPTAIAMEEFRAGLAAGAVETLCNKHLLAAHTRGCGSESQVPRAYYLPPKLGLLSHAGLSYDPLASKLSACDERDAFFADFALSQAALVLQCACEEATASFPLEDNVVAVACTVCRRYIEGDVREPWLYEHEWRLLEAFWWESGCAPVRCVSSAKRASSRNADAQAVLKQLKENLPELQIQHLIRNVWILKPVAGAHGQGIALVNRLDEYGEPVETVRTAKCSFTRRALGDAMGYVAQKYMERPHLLHIGKGDIPNFPGCGLMAGEHVPTCVSGTICEPRMLHKYSLRFWVDVYWSALQPEAWLYEDGYVQVANSPYTEDLAEPTAHVTNLAQQPASVKVHGVARSRRPRMHSICDYQAFLANTCGALSFAEVLLPRIRAVASHALGAVRPAEGPSGPKWWRLGFDFAISEDLSVWLIEVNHKPGMGAPKGRGGDMLHSLVARLFDAERRLRANRIGGGIAEGVEHMSEGHGRPAECRFVRLDVPSWSEQRSG